MLRTFSSRLVKLIGFDWHLLSLVARLHAKKERLLIYANKRKRTISSVVLVATRVLQVAAHACSLVAFQAAQVRTCSPWVDPWLPGLGHSLWPRQYLSFVAPRKRGRSHIELTNWVGVGGHPFYSPRDKGGRAEMNYSVHIHLQHDQVAETDIYRIIES